MGMQFTFEIYKQKRRLLNFWQEIDTVDFTFLGEDAVVHINIQRIHSKNFQDDHE